MRHDFLRPLNILLGEQKKKTTNRDDTHKTHTPHTRNIALACQCDMTRNRKLHTTNTTDHHQQRKHDATRAREITEA